MSVHLGYLIPNGIEVDHIDNDKLNDRIENYQLLKKIDNLKKVTPKPPIECTCPVCGTVFFVAKRRLGNKAPNEKCCSRRCGGIYSHR